MLYTIISTGLKYLPTINHKRNYKIDSFLKVNYF